MEIGGRFQTSPNSRRDSCHLTQCQKHFQACLGCLVCIWIIFGVPQDHPRKRPNHDSDLSIVSGCEAPSPSRDPHETYQPHPIVQIHAKERMFLHGILDTKGVTRLGHATACMDLPCEWAQFLYSEVVKRGGENGVARSPCFGDIISEKGCIQR